MPGSRRDAGSGRRGDARAEETMEAGDACLPPLPLTPTGARPDWHDPAAWLRAERRSHRALVDAATAVARLDERLRRMIADHRAAAIERVALTEAADLLWAEGVRLRAERLALADRGRIGRSWDDAQAVSRASWAVRRLTADTVPVDSPAALRTFLGLHRVADAGEEDLDRDGLWLSGMDEHAAGDWCSAIAALAEAHCLTQAAAGFHLWRGFALSPPARLLEASVIAARLGAGMGKGGLRAVPIAYAHPRSVPAGGGDAAQRLVAWLDAVPGAAMRVHLMLDRMADWQARARVAISDMQGRGAPALLRLIAARPVLSARDVADSLKISRAQARLLLDRLRRKGLVREVTGQERFRFWTAAL